MATYKVTLLSTAENINVTIDCPDDKFILEAAEDNNIELPYSCRAGSCSTCLGKVTSGTIDQPDQTFLDEDQTGAGFILTCVASYIRCDSFNSRRRKLILKNLSHIFKYDLNFFLINFNFVVKFSVNMIHPLVILLLIISQELMGNLC